MLHSKEIQSKAAWALSDQCLLAKCLKSISLSISTGSQNQLSPSPPPPPNTHTQGDHVQCRCTLAHTLEICLGTTEYLSGENQSMEKM